MKNKNIIVNGVEREVDFNRVDYDQLVMLAHGPNLPAGVQTITYFRGPAAARCGSLAPDESVGLRDGMVFTVVSTSRA
jgi:hypothetical protein